MCILNKILILNLLYLFSILGLFAVDKKVNSSSPKEPSGSSKSKPIFASKVVTAQTPGQVIDIAVGIKALKELHLYVSDTGNGYSCDWAGWVNPRLVDVSGNVTKLTSIKWKHASSDWGQVNLNKNAQGGLMRVAGKEVQGIGCHANSLISYQS